MHRREFLKGLAVGPLAAAVGSAGSGTTEAANEALRERVLRGLRRRVGAPDARYLDRLAAEWPVVRRWGAWFELLAAVADAVRGAGLMLDPASGQLAESLTAFALGATELDPVEWRLQPAAWAHESGPPWLALTVEWDDDWRWTDGLPARLCDRDVVVRPHGAAADIVLADAGSWRGAPRIEVRRDLALAVLGRTAGAVGDRLSCRRPADVRIVCAGCAEPDLLDDVPDAAGRHAWIPAPLGFDDAFAFGVLETHAPATFEELAAVAALAVAEWPLAASRGGLEHEVLRRCRAGRIARLPHPAAVPIVRDTWGLPLYTDQVAEIVAAVASFPAGAVTLLAAELRRRARADLAARPGWHEAFMRAGVPSEQAVRLLDWLRDSSTHVPRATALREAFVAWWSAELASRHPDVYVSTLLATRRAIAWPCRCGQRGALPRPGWRGAWICASCHAQRRPRDDPHGLERGFVERGPRAMLDDCPACDGTGGLIETWRDGSDWHEIEVPCGHCGGSGDDPVGSGDAPEVPF